MKNLTRILAAGAFVVAGTGVASADEVVEYWPASQYGIEITAGGGVEGFTDERMQNTTDTGGLWDVRAVLGTRSPVSLEAAYTGSAKAIDSVFGGESATLVGNGVEADVRLNLLPMEVFTPYAFGGIGYRRYDVSGADFTTADTGINDEDTLLEVPIGGGASYRSNGFVFDARFTYRAAAGEDLVVAADGDEPDDVDVDSDLGSDAGAAGLDTWAVTARIGAEF